MQKLKSQSRGQERYVFELDSDDGRTKLRPLRSFGRRGREYQGQTHGPEASFAPRALTKLLRRQAKEESVRGETLNDDR